MKQDNSLDFKNEQEREEFKMDVLIQEYRKASAEKLGKSLQVTNPTGFGKTKTEYWLPDINANQREMIEDWLIEQKIDIECHSYLGYEYKDTEVVGRFKYHCIKIRQEDGQSFSGENESKLIAFAKVFMEYIK